MRAVLALPDDPFLRSLALETLEKVEKLRISRRLDDVALESDFGSARCAIPRRCGQLERTQDGMELWGRFASS